jgi:hypothetical protein
MWQRAQSEIQLQDVITLARMEKYNPKNFIGSSYAMILCTDK